MTADAKVGLLLGLVFIVMIAFLINGLPKFLQNPSPDDVITTAIAMPTTQELVIDPRIVETAQHLQTELPLRQATPPDEVVVSEGRTVSPSTDPVSPVMPEPVAPQITPAPVTVPTVPAEPRVVQNNTPKTRIHVVQSGENLAAIAQKYYGKEEGNRRVVIQKLYEANRSVLESPDKVCAGDKLTIPLLQSEPQSAAAPKPVSRPAVAASPQRTLMDKFTGMFEKTKESSQPRVYIVQRGDSLWGIAEKTLGDGKRYQEIVQLNRGIKAEDLVVGMSLKIPNK